MPAWGAEGGGPLTTQQIDELIAYLGSIQLTSDEAQARGRGGAARGARPRRGRRRSTGTTPPSARRCSTSASSRLRRRRLLLRPLPHEGGLVPVRRRRARGRRPERLRRLPRRHRAPSASRSPAASSRASSSPSTTSSIPRRGHRVRRALRPARPGHRPHAGLRRQPRRHDDSTTTPSDGMFTDEMLCAVAEYEASLGGATSEPAPGCDGPSRPRRADHRHRRPPRSPER